jgi:hypothetical protein
MTKDAYEVWLNHRVAVDKNVSEELLSLGIDVNREIGDALREEYEQYLTQDHVKE